MARKRILGATAALFITILVATTAFNGATAFGLTTDDQGSDSLSPTLPQQVRKWSHLAGKYANKFGVPKRLILSIIWKETRGDPYAIGPDGEIGLMQVHPDTAQGLLNEDLPRPTSTGAHIRQGTKILAIRRGMLKTEGGFSERNWVRSYNGGMDVLQSDTLSQDYADDVLRKWKG